MFPELEANHSTGYIRISRGPHTMLSTFGAYLPGHGTDSSGKVVLPTLGVCKPSAPSPTAPSSDLR